MKKFFNTLGTLFLVCTVVLAVWIMVQRIAGNTPSVCGYQLFQVVTGSMEPEYMVGDVILVQKTALTELQTGDDITYESNDGQTAGLMITHRLIEQPYQGEDDVWHLQTAGIAPGATPDAAIVGQQVLGKVIWNCKVLTVIYKLFTTKVGFLLFLMPLCVMMVIEVTNLCTLLKKGDSESAESEEET